MKRLQLATMLCLVGFGQQVAPAAAHSWYPPDCCSGQDCAVLTDKKLLPNGEHRYSTPLGAGDTTPATSIRDSQDNQTHVCIRYGRVVCIFFPRSL